MLPTFFFFLTFSSPEGNGYGVSIAAQALAPENG
jgi:hypothetical protein